VLKRVLTGLALLATVLLVAVGCGSSDDNDKDSEKSRANMSKTEKAKFDNLDGAKENFEKNGNDLAACRNLANAYVVVGSPESTGDPKKAPKVPEDREKYLKKSLDVLKQCTAINGKDIDTKQSLALTYVALSDYDSATPLLKEVALTRKTDENSYYAWGLAAGNAQKQAETITAWTNFLKYAPKNDPRRKQVRQSLELLKA
jgi:hypothetical protein